MRRAKKKKASKTPSESDAVRDANPNIVLDGLKSIEESPNPLDGLAKGETADVPLASMLAAQQIIQLTEGWRYLSSAFGAFVDNAQPQCIHTAYYAQLKAAISLYASKGILLNDYRLRYWSIEKNSELQVPNCPTHKTCWALWDLYSKKGFLADLVGQNAWLSDQIKVSSISSAFTTTIPPEAEAVWGYDFSRFAGDHVVRNHFSYDPVWRDRPVPSMTGESIAFFEAAWSFILPNPAGNIPFGETYAGYIISRARSGLSAPQWDKARAYAIRELSSEGGYTEAFTEDFLDRLADLDKTVLEHALRRDERETSVVARAIVLLCLSNLSLKANLGSIGASRGGVAKWLGDWLERGGIDAVQSDLSGMELSDDYSDAKENISALENQDPLETWWQVPRLAGDASYWKRPHAALSWDLNYEIYGA